MKGSRLVVVAEGAGWAFGLAGMVWWGAFQADMASSTKHDLERFATLRQLVQEAGTPDQALWSPARVAAWRRAMLTATAAPVAVLRVPAIGLEVPVLAGTANDTLDRGVGHIEGTAQPGTEGNMGLAGHRDGFFRGLKDLNVDDVIEVDTTGGTEVYRVERTWVVDPGDVSVLNPTPRRSLTLVTCYPFYFVGSAPHRFIVRAVRADGPASRVGNGS